MMKRARIEKLAVVLIGLLFYAVGSSPANGKSVDISGYWKSYLQVINPPSISIYKDKLNASTQQMVTNRLRLKLFRSLSESVNLTVAYDLSPRYYSDDAGAYSESATGMGIGTQIYRAEDLSARPWKSEHGQMALYQNLDRLVVEWSLPRADIYVGRQAVAWGSAKVVNPTDILAPFAYGELDVEDRVGVDAVRVRAPLGLMGELDGGWAFGKDFDAKNSAWFLRGKYFLARTDFFGIVSGFRGNLLLGIDLTRPLGGAGSWLEAAYVIEGADSEGHRSKYWRVSLGADYSLPDGTYLFAEYHYNEPGRSDPEAYPGLTRTVPYTEGAVYLLGNHYFIPGVQHQITPLLSVTLESLINVDYSHPSAYLTCLLEYNLTQNSYLSGGIYKSAGKGPEALLLNGTFAPQPQSEFGSYPDLVYFSYRLYF